MYNPGFISSLVYMLQSTEYQAIPYLKWYWRTQNFNKVALRRNLERTTVAKSLRAVLILGILAEIIAGASLILSGLIKNNPTLIFVGALLIIIYPIIWAHLIILPMLFGRVLIINPKNRKLKAHTKQIFSNHHGITIAIAGSYGKTTMKEILLTVLSQGKKVAATVSNKNVPSEHAKFASKLTGDEDIVIVEYGEEKPGDIADFANTTHPNIGVITGVAPAHLDKYKTLEAAASDIFSLAEYLKDNQVYVNGDNLLIKEYIKDSYLVFSQEGLGNWKTANIKIDVNGMSFKLKNSEQEFNLHTQLIGRHLIGPLCAAVAIGHSQGMSKDQIVKGVGKTKPYEHRMEPKQIAGAWVIDDTYNGTIEGMRSGLELLKELTGKRKIYVTPGLVDQGKEKENVHFQLGKYIAQAAPDITVLMRNSATEFIEKGLNEGNYEGNLLIQNNPVEFYSNLDKFVAVGDVVLMQNDWTDNYN